MYWQLNGGHLISKVIKSLFFLCLIQFSMIWIYPPRSFGVFSSIVQDRVGAGPFVYFVFISILVVSCFYFKNCGLSFLVQVLNPWVPLLVFSFASCVLSDYPVESMRQYLLFVLMLLSSVVIVSAETVSYLHKKIYYSLLFILVGCCLYSIFLPSYGVQYYGSATVWRGFFAHKNGFGWFSAISFIVFLFLFDARRVGLSVISIFLSAIGLLLSGSKTSLVAILFCCSMIYLLKYLRGRISIGLAFLAFLFVSLLVMGFAFFEYQDALSLLGRDVTLTGRTVIWNLFFTSMKSTPFFGAGPGSYTGLSELTLPIAMRLYDYGYVANPHNIILAAFGDVGLLGLASFVFLLFYLSFVQFYKYRNIYSVTCTALIVLFVVAGFTEAHEVISPGVAMFLVVIFRAMSIKYQADIVEVSAGNGKF